jgi:hypothetical protein
VGTFPRTRPSELVDRTVQPLRVGPLTAQPTCPRCGSPHIVPAHRDALPDEISALRGGSGSAEFATGEFDAWFCSACGQGWPHLHRPPTKPVPERARATAPPTGAATLLEDLLDPGELPPAREIRTASAFFEDPRSSRTQRRFRTWWMVVIALLLVASVGAIVRFAPFARDGVDGRTDPAAGRVASSDRHRASPRGIHAVLRLDRPTWVRAVADGDVVGRSEEKPGDPIVLHAKKVLRLVLGNGGAVQLRLNGERVKTGPAGEGITLTFVRKHGEILTRTA